MRDYEYVGKTREEKIILLGKKTGLTDEEIQQRIQKRRDVDSLKTPPQDSLAEIIQIPKTKYLHLFIGQTPAPAYTLSAFEAKIAEPLAPHSYSIFKLNRVETAQVKSPFQSMPST